MGSRSVEFKLSTLQFLRNPNVSDTAKEFGVDRKQERQWNEMRHVLIQNQTGKQKEGEKIHPGKHVVSEELDLAVLEFLEEERAAGRVVRNKDLSTRALEIAGKPSFFSDCFEQIACMLVRVSE